MAAIGVLTWDLPNSAQRPEVPRAPPAWADSSESRHGLLRYDLPTGHMRLKPLRRHRSSGDHQAHERLRMNENPSTSGIPISQISTSTGLARRWSMPSSADRATYTVASVDSRSRFRRLQASGSSSITSNVAFLSDINGRSGTSRDRDRGC